MHHPKIWHSPTHPLFSQHKNPTTSNHFCLAPPTLVTQREKQQHYVQAAMPTPATPHAAASSTTAAGRRRVMLIADQTRESSAALQWALSHAVVEHDEIVLLHVEQQHRRGGGGGGGGGGGFSTYFRSRPTPVAVAVGPGSSFVSINSAAGAAEGGEGDLFLEAMQAECEKAQPKVRVRIERVEMDAAGKLQDKAAVILAQTKMLGADLLVIGQRRTSTILGRKLSGSISGKPDTAEYLIDNSKCLCVGVQKKGQNAGYLLNTKTHKNFWLLA